MLIRQLSVEPQRCMVTPRRISKTFVTNGPDPDNPTNGTSAVFRALWDEKYLYVFAEVLDADPNPENRLGSPDFITDGIEIQIDEQNDKSGKNNVPAGNACAGRQRLPVALSGTPRLRIRTPFPMSSWLSACRSARQRLNS